MSSNNLSSVGDMHSYEVWFLDDSTPNGKKFKGRPVVIIDINYKEEYVIALTITGSNRVLRPQGGDVRIEPDRQNNLKKTSVVATTEKNIIKFSDLSIKMGNLSLEDLKRVETVFNILN